MLFEHFDFSLPHLTMEFPQFESFESIRDYCPQLRAQCNPRHLTRVIDPDKGIEYRFRGLRPTRRSSASPCRQLLIQVEPNFAPRA